MRSGFNRVKGWLTAFTMAVLALACPVFAAGNPSTGDNNQVILMTVLLVVSAIVIVALLVVSNMKKKNGKK